MGKTTSTRAAPHSEAAADSETVTHQWVPETAREPGSPAPGPDTGAFEGNNTKVDATQKARSAIQQYSLTTVDK